MSSGRELRLGWGWGGACPRRWYSWAWGAVRVCPSVCVPGLGLQLLGVRWLLLLGLAGAAWLGDGRTESQG